MTILKVMTLKNNKYLILAFVKSFVTESLFEIKRLAKIYGAALISDFRCQ